MPNSTPPPVRPVQSAEQRMPLAVVNYQRVVETLKENGGAEAKAIRAMFGGDKGLMDRFLAVVFSALANNRDILECDPLSIVQSIKDAASLGLEPTGLTGEGAIIPYKGIATFQPMWRGYLKRIRNSGKVVDVDCQIVYEGDEFDVEFGTNPSIRHKPVLPGDGERGNYRGVYAWAQMPSGLFVIEWMPLADVNAVRDQFSPSVKAGRASPWDTSYGEMARKTAIKRLSKRLPGAAVDDLLRVEARGDRVAAEARAEQNQLRGEVNDVRQMALRAVGLAQLGPGDPAEDAQPTQEDAGSPTPEQVAQGLAEASAAASGSSKDG